MISESIACSQIKIALASLSHPIESMLLQYCDFLPTKGATLQHAAYHL